MRKRLRLREFHYYVLHHLELDDLVLEAFPELLYPSDTQESEPFHEKMRKFETSTGTLEQRLKEKVTMCLFLESFYVFTRFHTASRTPTNDNLGDDFDTFDLIIEANESRGFDDFGLHHLHWNCYMRRRKINYFNASTPSKQVILTRVYLKRTMSCCIANIYRYLDYNTFSFRIVSEKGFALMLTTTR